MKLAALLFLLAAPVLQFRITDERGKETGAITIAAGAPNDDGWRPLRIAKFKGDPVLVWPFDGLAKEPDGPEPVPAIVIQRGDEKALANKRVMAALATAVVLGTANPEDTARKSGLPAAALVKSFADLAPADAAKSLDAALRERQRQLTRVPSEIYPAAMLDGLALLRANKFDAAAVVYSAALKQRPSDEAAMKLRDEALVRAGKPEATGR
jgi:hypothetical protein